MIAVVPVRAGVLPAGAGDAVAETGGVALYLEWNGPTAVAAAAAPLVADHDVVVLPASPDGRDLAPLLAHLLGRPLVTGAIAVSATHADVVRHGGRSLTRVRPGRLFIATLQPGVTGAQEPTSFTVINPAQTGGDATIIEVLPPDAATVDLIEAPRIVSGGAGLDGAARFEQLARIGAALDASVGATRVITDRGWIGHERQIGTTGVVVDPQLYLAFGISGAVQHTSGLGSPEHIVAVNTDAHCPMMQLADLALVADANSVLDELEHRLTR